MNRMTKEYKIGETFVVNGEAFKVRESSLCDGCVLNYPSDGCLNEAGVSFGHCSALFRSDRKSVIFVKDDERTKPLKVVEKRLLPLTRCVEMRLENGDVVRLGQCQYCVCVHPELTCDKCEYNFSLF